MWKSKIYKWHKIIGITTAIPVFFWCISGLMHPFMSHWFKPEIPNTFIKKPPLNTKLFQLPLKSVLNQNKLTTFQNAHTLVVNNEGFYQVETKNENWKYFNAKTGKEWENGDKKYAEFLARYFLADNKSKLISIQRQTSFDQHYKYINRLLPVWKLKFDRPDGMEIYIETSYSRLATFNTTARKAFITIFDVFHNWGFLSYIGNNTIRICVMLLFLGIITLSALSGILVYGFMWKRFAPVQKDKPKTIYRKYHRSIGISVAFVTLTFAFSGGYHALTKWEPNVLPQQIVRNNIQTNQLGDSTLHNLSQNCVSVAFVKMNDQLFEQQITLDDNYAENKRYFNVKTGKELHEGDVEYALYLAKKLGVSPTNNAQLAGFDLVQEFENREYGFANKRLPVVRLKYNTKEHLTNYIETTTGRLAATITDSKRYEGYSFAILHKFLLIDWAGKNVRDGVTLFAAFGDMMACLFGLILFFKK